MPVLSAKAATPFVSMGVQPTLTLVGTSWSLSNQGGMDVHRMFFTYDGGFSAGVKSNKYELYIEYSWKNSQEEYDNYGNYIIIEDTTWSSTNYSHSMRLKDNRIKTGVRLIVSSSANERVESFVGVGFSSGTTKWSQYSEYYERTYLLADTEHYEPLSTSFSSRENNWNSSFSIGGFVELGSRFVVYQDLSVATSGQLHVFGSEFDETTIDNYSWGHIGQYYIEPMFSLALRWDFRK